MAGRRADGSPAGRPGARTPAGAGLRLAALWLAGALLLGGCTDPPWVRYGPWQKTGADAEQRAFDLQTCRSQVAGQLETHLAHSRRENMSRVDSASPAGPMDQSTLQSLFTDIDIRRERDRMVAECMQRLGYDRERHAWPG